jgi:ribokinase
LVDYLVLNETELAFYAAGNGLGSGASKARERRDADAAQNPDAIREAARRILAAGAKGVVVTRGACGGVAVTERADFSYSPFAVDAVDSTGAGDSFCAALLVGLSDGMPFEQAVRFASAAGALACTRFGAHPSLPWRHEVEALLERSEE